MRNPCWCLSHPHHLSLNFPPTWTVSVQWLENRRWTQCLLPCTEGSCHEAWWTWLLVIWFSLGSLWGARSWIPILMGRFPWDILWFHEQKWPMWRYLLFGLSLYLHTSRIMSCTGVPLWSGMYVTHATIAKT